MDRLTAASFLAFAAKQTQIKTFDVNLLAEAEELQPKMGGVRKTYYRYLSLSLRLRNLHNKCVYEFGMCINA